MNGWGGWLRRGRAGRGGNHRSGGSAVRGRLRRSDRRCGEDGEKLAHDLFVICAEAGLIAKCAGNLSSGLRPLIVTTDDGVGGAKALARQAGIDERIDVVEIEQFLAMSLYERSRFARDARSDAVAELVDRYNGIVVECETDPSLKIVFER